MLIRSAVLKRIKAGEVSLAFRRWRRPTVKSGGTLRTALGVLSIAKVEKVGVSRIPSADARAAGYSSKQALLEDLRAGDGDVYRISLEFAGVDPRVALRDDDTLSDGQRADIRSRLRRLDDASAAGPWTYRFLALIRDRPHVAARVLADEVGWDRDRFKLNVRKLKNLGLTASHHPGYTLSRRGARVLDDLHSRR